MILAAYACYGKDCLQHFDGMFAFAIWDALEQTLFCARDRFGEKPFYFYTNSSEVIFASEMKALWAAGVERAVSDTHLLNYLAHGSVNVSGGDDTFFRGIFKLTPAHYMEIKIRDGGLKRTCTRYWQVDKKVTTYVKDSVAIDGFMELLTTSIKRRLRSDVALGTSLSGGLDSSSIATLIQSIAGSDRQKTFSAIFPGFDRNEETLIDELSETLHAVNYKTIPDADGMIQDFHKLIHHQEEPFQSSSIYAQYKVYELAKQHNVTVLLDGQGADETLAGYHKYYHWYWQELVASGKWGQAISEKNTAKALGIQVEWGAKNIGAAYLPNLTRKRLQKKSGEAIKGLTDINPNYFEDHQLIVPKPIVRKLNDILYYDTFHHSLEELLRFADRNSMAHSREVRLPFLSHELVQYIFSLPSNLKIRNGYTKWILRQAMDNKLPQQIVWRKDKVGFEPPQKSWMQQHQVIEYVQEAKRTLVSKGVLNQTALNKPINALPAHEKNNYDWRYLCAAHCM